MTLKLVICVILAFQCYPVQDAFLVVPEDVGTGFAAIYGFSPRIVIGRDHRFGFGFRFGNHADLQILYELGPQTTTRQLQTTTRVRSAAYQYRSRRRPFIELLLKAGLLIERNDVSNRLPGSEEDLQPR